MKEYSYEKETQLTLEGEQPSGTEPAEKIEEEKPKEELEIKTEAVTKERPKKVKETKTPYLLCPFCEKKNYKHTGRDESSSWCEYCGRCFTVNWQEE